MTDPLSRLSGMMRFPRSTVSDEDLSALDEDILSKRSSMTKNILASQTEPKMDLSQALAAGIMSLAPALIGMAIAKKKGGAMGAEVGLGTSGSYLAQVEKRNKSDQNAAKAQALTEEEELKELRGERKDALKTKRAQEFQGQRDEYIQGRMDDRASKYRSGTTINMPGKPFELSGKSQELVRSNLQMAKSGQDILDYVSEKAPKLLDESFQDEKGDWDLKKSSDVYAHRIGDFFAGGETEHGKFLQRLNNFISKYQKELSGLASTDKEFDRIYGQIVRSGAVVPQTVPQTLGMIEYLQNASKGNARAEVALARASQNADEQSIDNLFNDFAPGRKKRGRGLGDLSGSSLVSDEEKEAIYREELGKLQNGGR